MSHSCNPWIVAHQDPLSMKFSRQENWSRLSLSSPGHLPDPGIKPESPASQADSLPLSHGGSSLLFSILPTFLRIQWSWMIRYMREEEKFRSVLKEYSDKVHDEEMKTSVTNCMSSFTYDKSHDAKKILCSKLETSGFSIYVYLSTGFISKCHFSKTF